MKIIELNTNNHTDNRDAYEKLRADILKIQADLLLLKEMLEKLKANYEFIEDALETAEAYMSKSDEEE